MSPEVALSAGQTRILENGARLYVLPGQKEKRKSRPQPGSTALHEAEHAVVAEKNGTSVVMVTIVPTRTYRGLTQLSRFDAIAAAAPHSHGRGGTSFDLFVIARSGKSVEASISEARSVLSNTDEEVKEVATMLEERRTASGHEVREAMGKAGKENKEKKPEEVVVFIKQPDGSERKVTNIRKQNNILYFPKAVIEDQSEKMAA